MIAGKISKPQVKYSLGLIADQIKTIKNTERNTKGRFLFLFCVIAKFQVLAPPLSAFARNYPSSRETNTIMLKLFIYVKRFLGFLDGS